MKRKNKLLIEALMFLYEKHPEIEKLNNVVKFGKFSLTKDTTPCYIFTVTNDTVMEVFDFNVKDENYDFVTHLYKVLFGTELSEAALRGDDPDTLSNLIDSFNYITFNFRAPFFKFKEITGGDYNNTIRSLKLLINNNKNFVVETYSEGLTESDLSEMADTLYNLGYKGNWIIHTNKFLEINSKIKIRFKPNLSQI